METANDVPCSGDGPHMLCENKKELSLGSSVERFKACSRTSLEFVENCSANGMSPLETLPSQLCAFHNDTSTHVKRALFETDCKESSHNLSAKTTTALTRHRVNASRNLDTRNRKTDE